MDTLSAFVMGEVNRDKPLRVFDWDKAARILRERNATFADAGLEGDWEYTGGAIPKNGDPVPAEETYTYLASTWATPILDIDGEEIACWRYDYETPGYDPASGHGEWDAATYWPESALRMFRYGDVIDVEEVIPPFELSSGDG